jgi:hypothetical protein
VFWLVDKSKCHIQGEGGRGDFSGNVVFLILFCNRIYNSFHSSEDESLCILYYFVLP